MNSSLNVRELALALGAAQGIFLAVFLALHNKNRMANRILAVFLILAALAIASPEFIRKYCLVFPHLIGSTFTITFLLGPVLFLYVKCLTGVKPGLRLRPVYHFLPFLAATAYLLPFYLQAGEDKIAFFKSIAVEGLPLDFMVIWGSKCLHIVVYFAMSLQLLKRHSQQIKNSFSYLDKINLTWLRNLTIGNAGIWLLYLVSFVLYALRIEIDPLGVLDHVFGYAMSVLVYAIGYMGLKQPEIFSGIHSAPQNSKKYERSGLTPEKAAEYAAKLMHYMENTRPFKNAELTLQELAAELSIPPNHLSQVINDKLCQNFFDFINGYRVKEAQQALRDPAKRHLTILAIAYEVGFNSKSAFNAVFKKHTDMTPSQFKKTSKPARQDDSVA